MFYLLFITSFLLVLGSFLFCKFKFKNEKFDIIMEKILKIFVIIYCALIFLNILLPDSFVISLTEIEANESPLKAFAVLRWFSTIAFIVLPISIFFNNRTMRNIATYICIPVTIISIICYHTYLEGFTSELGRGLTSISVISEGFKSFLRNATFRSFYIGLIWVLELLIPIISTIQRKHIFNIKNKTEWINFALIFIGILFCSIPIYIPQYIIGYTNLIFTQFSLVQLIWILFIIAEIVSLYFFFRNKTYEDRYILVLVLALALLLQYNQMFGAVSISMKRLPLQLCNIGSYLVLAAILTKNKTIFDFTVIVNVVGVLLAVAVPDLDGEGIGYLWNIHFILEHNNVLVVPILMLILKVMPKLDKDTIKHFFIGFTSYFVIVFILGTLFNGIANITENSFYEANYLFMFIKEESADVLSIVGPMFDLTIKLGAFTIFPIIQIVVYVVFSSICMIIFGLIMLIYKLTENKNIKVENELTLKTNEKVENN